MHTIITLIVALGAALAFASAVALAVALVISAVHIVLVTPSGQAWRGKRALAKQRRLRRERRATRMGAPRAVLEALETIVENILGDDPRDQFDLEMLLERYVDLATAHDHCLTVLARANVPGLERRLARSNKDGMAEAVALRRLCHARTLEQQAAQLDESAQAIAELLCYSAELAHAPTMEMDLDSPVLALALERYDAYESLNQELNEGACNGEHDWQSYRADVG